MIALTAKKIFAPPPTYPVTLPPPPKKKKKTNKQNISRVRNTLKRFSIVFSYDCFLTKIKTYEV